VSGQHQDPAALLQEEQSQFSSEVGVRMGLREDPGNVKILDTTGSSNSEPWVVHPVASCYTDSATVAP
jgi:hypothetical protein